MRTAAHTTTEGDRQPSGRVDDFAAISLPAPTLVVDTTDGYDPPLPEIVNFVNDRQVR